MIQENVASELCTNGTEKYGHKLTDFNKIRTLGKFPGILGEKADMKRNY